MCVCVCVGLLTAQLVALTFIVTFTTTTPTMTVSLYFFIKKIYAYILHVYDFLESLFKLFLICYF